MGFEVIDDLARADELAKAGLLWYDCQPFGGDGWPATWEGSGWQLSESGPYYPTLMVKEYPGSEYIFFILTEE